MKSVGGEDGEAEGPERQEGEHSAWGGPRLSRGGVLSLGAGRRQVTLGQVHSPYIIKINTPRPEGSVHCRVQVE